VAVVRCFVICVALTAGCGRRGETKLEHVRDAVCRCQTASCADDAMKAMPQDEIVSTPRTQKIAREMLDCLSRLYEDGRPTTDPDAPTQQAARPESSEHAAR
jgi:hypothetical protein